MEHIIHPDTQALIDAYQSSGAPPLAEGTVEQAREQMVGLPQLLGAGPQVGSVSEIEIPGPAGPIRARVLTPDQEPIATIVYLHGGGWVAGNLDGWDPLCRMLTKESRCKVVVVDYRQAPEHPFPAAADDAFAALQWVAEHGADAPLVVAGDSAGGNLAAVCAVRARDHGSPDLALQVLFYPVTDHDFETDSYKKHGENPLLSGSDMKWFWSHYAPTDEQRSHPHASPLRTDDLSGVAPAYVVVAEHDVIRDEAQAYADRLEQAGVPVTVRWHADQTHGFVMMVNFLPAADEAVRDVASFIREAVTSIR